MSKFIFRRHATTASDAVKTAVEGQEDLEGHVLTPTRDNIFESYERAHRERGRSGKARKKRIKEQQDLDFDIHWHGRSVWRWSRLLPELKAINKVLAKTSAIVVVSATSLLASAFVIPNQTDRGMAAFVNMIAPVDAAKVAHLEEALDCATARLVLGAEGALLGYGPSGPVCGAPGDQEAASWAPSLLTAPVSDEQVARYFQIIAAVEGDHAGSGTVLSISLPGLARAAKSWLTGGPRIGGSTPFLSAIEVLFDDQGKELTLSDKLSNLLLAAQLSAGPFADRAARDAFVVTVLPAAIEMHGPRRGLALAGNLLPQAVFGLESFAELGTGHLCILASGGKRPILLPGPNPSGQQRLDAAERLDYVKDRALTRCIDVLSEGGLLSDAEFERAKDEVAAYALPSSAVSITPPGLVRLLADARRIDGYMSTTEQLFVSRTGQEQLVAEIARLRADITPNLPPYLCAYECGHDQDQLDILAVAVRADDPNLPIVAAFSSRQRLWTGRIRDGVRIASTRAIASLVKILSAPVLIQFGADELCRERWSDLSDRGQLGLPCELDGAIVSFVEMLAYSYNTAFANGIKQAGTDNVADWLRALGATIPEGLEGEQLRRDIATGTGIQLSPESTVRAFAAIVAGLHGEVPEFAGPTLRVGDPTAALRLPSGPFAPDLRDSLGKALAAPITHPGGTLHALYAPLSEMGCVLLYGKTGSSEGVGPTQRELRDRLILLHAQCADRDPIIIFVMIGSPEIDLPLVGVTAADARRLAIATLQAALAGPDLGQTLTPQTHNASEGVE